MTLATAYRNKIDALWLDLHSGGITNPITVVEQISYLMFARLLDITKSREKKRSARLKMTSSASSRRTSSTSVGLTSAMKVATACSPSSATSSSHSWLQGRLHVLQILVTGSSA
jgi:hypothetical protein